MKRHRSWLLPVIALAGGCATTVSTTNHGEATRAAQPSPSPRVQGAIPPDEHPQNQMTNPAD